MSSTPPAPERRACRCGHTRGHPLVAGEARYSMMRLFFGFMMGASAGDPRAVVFRCTRCGAVVEETTDRDVLRAYRN
ncbi:MAG: hypothetical protein R3247_14155 [Rhodothermales bacterium]|nr:hypothetical protein [Rhodothermales bacterium]